jgi:hypothetical protein
MDIIEQIGSYAGLAAIVGLAVLSALYFSQARDLRRLRDSRGEDPAPAPGPGQAARRPPDRKPSTAQAAGFQPAATGRTQALRAPGTAARPAQGRPAAAGAPARPPAAAAPPGGRPWYRRIALRYIVLIVAGALVLGAGVAFGVASLASNGGGEAEEPVQEDSGQAAASPPLDPSTITVAVLNGTSTTGVATQLADTVESAGFQRGNVANATDQTAAESAVLYAEGAREAAREVGDELDISQVEPADVSSATLAGDADVIVVVGEDRAQ